MTWRRSAVSWAFGSLWRHGFRRYWRRRRQAPDGRQHLPPMPEQDANVLEVLIGQMGQYGDIDLVLSKALARTRTCRAYRATPQSLALRRTLSRTLRCSGPRLSETKALGHFGRGVLRLVMAALAPQGVLVSRYFPGRQTVAGIVLKLASRDLPAARRGPRMRQGRWRLCGSPQAPQARQRRARPHSQANPRLSTLPAGGACACLCAHAQDTAS